MKTSKGSFSYQGVSTRGVRHSPGDGVRTWGQKGSRAHAAASACQVRHGDILVFHCRRRIQCCQHFCNQSAARGNIPDLLFPCLFGKRQGKPPKGQGFLWLAEPLKSLEKKGKTLKIARNSLKRKKARKTKKARKRRLGIKSPKST